MAGNPAAVRYHAMDATRAFAMLLGVTFHAALSYIPADINWAVRDRSTSAAVVFFVIVSHAFRLSLFFVMAGFFARLVVKRRGLGGFVRQRVQRILLPFVAGWILVRPGMVFAWHWGDVGGAATDAPRAAIEAIVHVIFSPRDLLTGTHLWFLYYLLLIYAAFLILRAAIVLALDRIGAQPARLDSLYGTLVRSAWVTPLLALPTAAIILGMEGIGVDTPDRSLVPDVPVLLLYGSQFAFGWLLHRQPDLLHAFRRRWGHQLVLAVVVSLPAVCFVLVEPTPGRPGHFLLVLVAAYTYSLMMWHWIAALMGLFLRYLDSPSPAWRYVADSSYWLYIAHLPLVTTLQVALSTTPLHWTLKLMLIHIIALPVLFLSYHYLVRSTFIGRTLNGRTFPFRPLLWRGGGDSG